MLFDTRILAASSYFVTMRRWKRFLVNSAAGTESSAPTPITVVVNWQAGLKK